MPVADVVDLGQSPRALVSPHPIEKIVASFLRAHIDGHLCCEVGVDRSMILPGRAPSRSPPTIGPVAETRRDKGFEQQLAQCNPPRIGSGPIVELPLSERQKQSAAKQMADRLRPTVPAYCVISIEAA